MKKFALCFIVSILTVISMCACGAIGGNTRCKPDLNCSYSVNADIVYEDMTANAVLTRHDRADWSVEFSAPDTLAGVLLKFKDNNVEASYKGLSFSVPKTALPLKSIIASFIDTADRLAEKQELSGKEKDDEILVEGETDLGKYVLKFNGKNELSGFEMPNLDLVMKFSDFTVNSVTVPEQTAAITSAAPVPTETTPATEIINETSSSAEE